MMHNIAEIKSDLVFLKKFECCNKMWKEVETSDAKKKEKVCSNFLLHPKCLSSDSECSSKLDTPRKFLSEAMLKSLDIQELNNCSSLLVSQNNKDISSYVEDAADDVRGLKSSNTKTLISNKSVKLNTTENFDKKFKLSVEKILKLLDNIRILIEEGIPPPDGAEDYFRRTKRLQEFSARFSRIYLYPLLRQMDELSLPEKLGKSLINQKFLNAQQIILQALQAYYTHLPSSVDKCGSEKLKSLLDQIIYMCQLYELLKKDSNLENWEFVNAMRKYVEILLDTLTTFDVKFAEKNAKRKEVEKKSQTQGTKTIKQKPKSRFSMYLYNSSFKKELEYRKALECRAMKKSSVQSRYKTAGFKHRPPVEKPVLSNVENKISLLRREDSCRISKSSVRKTPIGEDEITTLVEMHGAVDTPPNTGENLNHENSNASSRQQLVQDRGDGMEEGNVEKALNVLRKFFGYPFEKKDIDFLENIASEVGKKKEEQENLQYKDDCLEKAPKKKIKEQVVTVTGAKNAKLICIRDDNSVEDAEYYRQDKEIMTDVEIKMTSSETQTEIRDKTQSKSTIKISRLPKHNKKVLRLLPKQYAINIIQYKLRYSQFHKQDPMYRKSAHIQPWLLMGKISDDVLDYILQSVSKELEVNEILENLYNAEFQY